VRRLLLALVLGIAGCSRAPATSSAGDAGRASVDAQAPDAGVEPRDAGPSDAIATDAALLDAAAPDAATTPRCETTPIDAPALTPTPGTLFLLHLGLGGFALGEATLAVLPDGTRVIIDVGNDSHADDVVAAARATFGDDRVDLVVLTHHHADHEDALPDVLAALDVGRVVHRGLTDLTDAANPDVMAELCAAAAVVAVAPVCTNGHSGCEPAAWRAPATACELPWTAGSNLILLGANARTSDADYAAEVGPLLTDDGNGENARSLVGVLAHGPFRYVFAGDLTGGGSDTDPVEGWYVRALGARLPAADVLHLSHHGRDTSSGPEWRAHLLPLDGRPRTAVAGVSLAHVGSPHRSVVRDVAPHLQGAGLFVTRVAPGGGADGVFDAGGGSVRIRTEPGGEAYLVQAVDPAGVVLRSERTTSAAACVP